MEADNQLKELLNAAKAKLASLNDEILVIIEENTKQAKLIENAENEKASLEKETVELRTEFKKYQTMSKDLSDKIANVKLQISKSKQELAIEMEDCQLKEKELLINIKKAQDEQKKFQERYKQLQKESDKFTLERSKIKQMKETLNKRQKQIAEYQKTIEDKKQEELNRIQVLEEHTRQAKELSPFY